MILQDVMIFDLRIRKMRLREILKVAKITQVKCSREGIWILAFLLLKPIFLLLKPVQQASLHTDSDSLVKTYLETFV